MARAPRRSSTITSSRGPLLQRSLPLRAQQVEVRLTGRTVEIFVKGERIAVHMRGGGRQAHTVAEHMPSSHRRYADWTVGRIRETPRSSGRQPPLSAISSWSSGPIPSRASDPASASCGWRGRSARTAGGRLRPRASRSARAPWLGPFHPRPRLDRHAAHQRRPRRRRSPTPTSAASATTNRRSSLLTHPTLDLLQRLDLPAWPRLSARSKHPRKRPP